MAFVLAPLLVTALGVSEGVAAVCSLILVTGAATGSAALAVQGIENVTGIPKAQMLSTFKKLWDQASASVMSQTSDTAEQQLLQQQQHDIDVVIADRAFSQAVSNLLDSAATSADLTAGWDQLNNIAGSDPDFAQILSIFLEAYHGQLQYLQDKEANAQHINIYPDYIVLPDPTTLENLNAWYTAETIEYQTGHVSDAQWVDIVTWYNYCIDVIANSTTPVIDVSELTQTPPGTDNPPVVVNPPVTTPIPVNPPVTVPIDTPAPVAGTGGNTYNLEIPEPVIDNYVTVNVPAVQAPAVTVENIVNPPMINNVVDMAQIGAALAAFAPAMAVEFAAKAGQMGHDSNVSQSICGLTTGPQMLANILQAAAPLALSLSMDKFGPFRDLMDKLFSGIWDKVLGDPDLQSPVTPERAPEVSRALFMDALEAGQTAHLISVVAESVAPLKTLGLGQLAAFMADMAGFAKIGGAMMGAVESQALTIPFKYYINDHTRSIIPGVVELERLAAEYHLIPDAERDQYLGSTDRLGDLDAANRAKFMQYGKYAGYTDDWLQIMYENTHRPGTYFNLRAMADAGMYDETYTIGALAHMGYEPSTITKMLDMLRRMSVKGTIDLIKSETRYDYIDGWIDAPTYQENLLSLGVGDAEADALVSATTQRRERDLGKRKVTYLTNMVAKGTLTLDDYQTELQNMGIDPEVITMDVLEAQLKVKEATAPKATARDKTRLASAYLEQLMNGYITIDEYQLDLSAIPLDATEIADKVKAAGLDLKRAQDSRRIKALQMQAEAGSIDRAELTSDLELLGISSVEASLIVAETKWPKAAPTRAEYLTAAGKVEVDTIRRERRAGNISDADELAALVALGMDNWLAQAVVDNDTTRIETKAKPASEGT